MATAAELVVKVTADIGSAIKNLGTAQSKLESIAQTGGIAGAALSDFGRTLTSAFTNPMVKAIDAARSFESQMDGVAAVLTPTAAEMESLTDLAKELGKTTQYTASEAGAGIEMLAKNNLKYEEIVGGALESTLALAAATGGDLTTSADIATDAMAVFNMQASDMMDAVNGITGVTVASKFDLNDYGLAIAHGGATASAAGLSIEEFNAVIAATASQFSSGMTAGTALSNFLMRLTPNTKTASDAMMALGLITEDGTNQFYTATGELKSMAEVAEILKIALGGLTEEQRLKSIESIFGMDAKEIGRAHV